MHDLRITVGGTTARLPLLCLLNLFPQTAWFPISQLVSACGNDAALCSLTTIMTEANDYETKQEKGKGNEA